MFEFYIRAKLINVLFPEMPRSVDSQTAFFFWNKILYRKNIKIIKNTLKIEEQFSDVPKQFGVGPKKVELVGFPETRHFCVA